MTRLNLTSRLTATRNSNNPTLTVLTVKIKGKNRYSKTQQQKFHLWASFYKLQKKTLPHPITSILFSLKTLEEEKKIIAAKNQKIISLFEEETWITTCLLTKSTTLIRSIFKIECVYDFTLKTYFGFFSLFCVFSLFSFF